MKKIATSHLLIVPALLAVLFGCSSTKDPYQKKVRLLQKGKITEDSSFVYQLPYEEGKKYRMIQGYFSSFSHKNRAALDFKMKRGTKICAARDGIVVRVKEDGDRGGWNAKYRPYGNNIVIQHADGSRAGYWHLQKDGALVNTGDTVKAGQVIALSGKTGYAAVPHLHFMVWSSGNSQWTQIPTRFKTKKGVKYLKPWKKYRKTEPQQ
jgi:murein DD-endopeptidase MepM/ murein hydrolase activator NlpD